MENLVVRKKARIRETFKDNSSAGLAPSNGKFNANLPVAIDSFMTTTCTTNNNDNNNTSTNSNYCTERGGRREPPTRQILFDVNLAWCNLAMDTRWKQCAEAEWVTAVKYTCLKIEVDGLSWCLVDRKLREEKGRVSRLDRVPKGP